MIASVAMDTPHPVYVLIRNVGEGNAEVKFAGASGPPEATMEPHTARLVVLNKGGGIIAKCTSPDTYTVLLLDMQAAAQLEPV